MSLRSFRKCASILRQWLQRGLPLYVSLLLHSCNITDTLDDSDLQELI